MPEPEERVTLPGTKLPPGKGLSPTLLFHRWQRYDCFWPDSFINDRGKQQELEPFKRDFAALRFLERVASEVQASTRQHYAAWYKRFRDAFEDLNVEPVLKATTLWRLVVGWGTNPAFETGITLDHFLGFPFIPGSAVKGLLHRVAELELLEAVGEEPAIPECPPDPPPAPAAELEKSLARALRVRALFGSLHLRRNPQSKTDPEAPFDRLAEWRSRLPQPGSDPDPWKNVREQLARLCSDAPAGGMVTCFDAVPEPKVFTEERTVLTPDVLNPHPLTPKDKGPIPIFFLAVRDGVTFELRYRLTWPAEKRRDPEEHERASDLGGINRGTVAGELKRWLACGLKELGLGGKTSAGYGYLLAEGVRLPEPELLKEDLSDIERQARAILPDEIGADRAVDTLDKVLNQADPALQQAVVARYQELFPDDLPRWRTSKRAATRKRVEAMDRLLGGNEEREP